jgi:hypothetical protein
MPNENNYIFTHESQHLWERQIFGMLLHKTLDYVMVSQDGMHIIALGNIQKRIIKTNE